MTESVKSVPAPRDQHLRDMADCIRFLSMDAVEKAKSGHPGMPMGMADIAVVLFSEFLKFDAEDPYWFDRDRFLISNGQADVQGVARYIGVPLRTFQRKLAAEGHSFGTLLNEARRELAVRYLANSNQSITMVAQLTGYSALSSFTRWFIAEFGVPPGKWRRTTRARNGRHLASPAAGAPPPEMRERVSTDPPAPVSAG